VLSKEENEFLTRIGPGTPGGELMRQYWHPVFPEVKLAENPVQRVRLLGEDLVLYRDRSGQLGLIGPRCPHRLMDMGFGIPEQDGLRCPYHGWLFNENGRCLEQPIEPSDSTFRERVKITGYPVQALGGLIWAYMGPEPAPLLPKWDLFVRNDAFRQISAHWLPCNWLQAQENRADVGHAIYLHGRLFQWVLEKQGRLSDDPSAIYNRFMDQQYARMKRGAYPQHRPIYNDYGFSKGGKESDEPDNVNSWTVGINPILFPYLLGFGPTQAGRIRLSYQFGVPIDDETTWHLNYHCYAFPEEIEFPKQDLVPYLEIPLKEQTGKCAGEYKLDYVLSQDMVGWYAQGRIVDRTQEHLGVSDVNVIAYRKMLREQIEKVQRGEEPINTFHDHDAAWRPELRIPGMYLEDDGTNYQMYLKLIEQDRGALTTQDDFLMPEYPLVCELYDKTEAHYRSRLEKSGARELVGAAAVNWPFR
jgi:5,5'-dehydrodivanillate O-demethylase